MDKMVFSDLDFFPPSAPSLALRFWDVKIKTKNKKTTKPLIQYNVSMI